MVYKMNKRWPAGHQETLAAKAGEGAVFTTDQLYPRITYL